MDFDELFERAEPETTTEVVALGLYYNSAIRGETETSAYTVKRVLSEAGKERARLAAGHVRSVLNDLVDRDLCAKRTSKYVVSDSGYEWFETLASPGVSSADHFVTVELETEFYAGLREEIDRCYAADATDAVQILSRKLLENLVLDLLRRRYGLGDGEDRSLFYDHDRGRLRSFHELLDNFEANLDDFAYYSDRLDTETVETIRNLKSRGNASAHSLELGTTDKELEQFREELNDVLDVLFYVYEELEASHEPSD